MIRILNGWMRKEKGKGERGEERMSVWDVWKMEYSILGNMDERSKGSYILSVTQKPTSMS